MKNGIRRLGRKGSPQVAAGSAAPRTLRLVSAALILREHEGTRQVLICQRKADQPMALKWEFPGGKIEAGESPEEALRRELNEELGIDADVAEPVAQIRHHYRNGGAVDLQFFAVRSFRGELDNRIFQEVRWSDFASLPLFDFLAADIGLVRDLAEGRIAPASDSSAQHAA